MNKYGSSFKPLMWVMALLLTAFVAGCGGGDDSGGSAPGPSAAGAVCTGTAADCVALGTDGGTFVILSTAGITNTGSHTTAITGNIGTSPITAAAMNDVFCSEITGTMYGVNAAYVGDGVDVTCFAGGPPPNANKDLVDNAVLDATAAFGFADAKVPGVGNTDLGAAGDITGLNLAPGVYNWTTGVGITGNVTLTGTASDVWVLQIAGGLTAGNGSTVTLVGALPQNVFWRTAGVAALGTTAAFKGVILSDSSITLATGATVDGRLYAASGVTLDANTVTRP